MENLQEPLLLWKSKRLGIYGYGEAEEEEEEEESPAPPTQLYMPEEKTYTNRPLSSLPCIGAPQRDIFHTFNPLSELAFSHEREE